MFIEIEAEADGVTITPTNKSDRVLVQVKFSDAEDVAEQVLNDVDGKSAILSRIVIDEAVEAWEQSEVLDHMGKEAALQHWNLQEKE